MAPISRPAATPAATGPSAAVTALRTASDGVAPSAIRKPNSRRRACARYATRPNTPPIPSSSATRPNPENAHAPRSCRAMSRPMISPSGRDANDPAREMVP